MRLGHCTASPELLHKLIALGCSFFPFPGGQLGIGGQYTLPVIPTPTEVALSKHAPKTGSLVCTHIAAGGSDSYFVAERSEPSRPTITELYAAGNGQFGAIGNGQWMHQTAPAKVKTLSGLLECGS